MKIQSNNDLVSRFQSLQTKKRELELEEVQIKTQLTSLNEKEESILKELKTSYELNSLEELTQRIEQEEKKIEDSLTQAEQGLNI